MIVDVTGGAAIADATGGVTIADTTGGVAIADVMGGVAFKMGVGTEVDSSNEVDDRVTTSGMHEIERDVVES